MYLGECRELGVPILPPDVNASELAFSVVPRGRPLRARARSRTSARARCCRSSPCAASTAAIDSLYHALRARRSAARQQARAREPGQGRRARLDLPRTIEPIALRRARLFAAVDKALEHGGRHQRDREEGQNQSRSAASTPVTTAKRQRGDSAARCAGLDRGAAARRREGSARLLHERPSARALRARSWRSSAPAASAS